MKKILGISALAILLSSIAVMVFKCKNNAVASDEDFDEDFVEDSDKTLDDEINEDEIKVEVKD